MIAVRKSIGLKYQSRQLATPGHVIFAYNIVQRCLSLLVWLLGVDYVLCTPCTAGSKRHRLSGSLLWVYVTISIFRGVGLSFHAFNESRPPCGDLASSYAQQVHTTHTSRFSSLHRTLPTATCFMATGKEASYGPTGTSQTEHFEHYTRPYWLPRTTRLSSYA